MGGKLWWVWVLAAVGLSPAVDPSRAANLRLAGPGASWGSVTILTNSVTCEVVLVENAHAILATSESDTALALIPDWEA